MYKKHDTKILVSCFLYMQYGLIESQKQSGIKKTPEKHEWRISGADVQAEPRTVTEK